jgi:hypothetical protein
MYVTRYLKSSKHLHSTNYTQSYYWEPQIQNLFVLLKNYTEGEVSEFGFTNLPVSEFGFTNLKVSGFGV